MPAGHLNSSTPTGTDKKPVRAGLRGGPSNPRFLFGILIPALVFWWPLGFTGTVRADGPVVSQLVAVTSPIVDEFGELLMGTDPSAGLFGILPVEGDLVQILLATDNVIYPPAIDGTPDPRNVVLTTSRIGLGTDPSQARPAIFGAVVSPRPGGNSRIFVRVFNAPSRAEASFYRDSELFKVLSYRNDPFIATVPAITQPLDPADSDGDGQNNSWAKSYGADDDHDGLSRQEEQLAGTDPYDAASFLSFSGIEPAGGDDLRLQWRSSPGKNYRVEARLETPEGQSPVFNGLASLVASLDTSEVVIPHGLSQNLCCFRVCVTSNP